jgi:hypothetical protein
MTLNNNEAISPNGATIIKFPKQTLWRKRRRGTPSPTLTPTAYSGGPLEGGNQNYATYNTNNNNSNSNMNGNGNGSVYGSTDDQVNSNQQGQQYSQLSQDDIHFGSVTLYSEMLLFGVILWIFYLLLPKGLRQFMCNAYPKRYAKSKPGREIPLHLLKFNHITQRESPRRVMRQYHRGGTPSEFSTRTDNTGSGAASNGTNHFGQQSTIHQRRGTFDIHSAGSPMSMDHRIDSGVTSGRQSLRPVGSREGSSVYSQQSPAVSNSSSTGTWDHRTAFERMSTPNANTPRYNGAITPFQVHDPDEGMIDFFTPTNPTVRPPPSLIELESLASFSQASPIPTKDGTPDPSPLHPNESTNHRVPSHMVLSSTLTSLREPGIRLNAHGTQCEPRRIWIQLEVHRELLEWRTENRSDPKEHTITGQETYTLGPKHTIPLHDIIYVDVGKTTSALQLLAEDAISSDVSFSILTKNGSLDLNAGNKLERDALISCFCLVLDTIHLDNSNEKSWRALHVQGSSVSQSTEDRSSNYQGSSSHGYYTSSSATSPTESDVFAGIDGTSNVTSAYEEV